MVMGRLGLLSCSNSGELELSEEEVEQLILMEEEEEVSFGEIEDVFKVFDENGDGFIEGKELQRVLECLGLKAAMKDCHTMIAAFDHNGDGMIDHLEFLTLMQHTTLNSIT